MDYRLNGVGIMRNLAVILGVSVYDHANNLSACKIDANQMHELLHATEKYQILQLDEGLTKNQIMEKLEEFFNADAEEDAIGEVLFYFSGHGCQDENDLHFILKGTEPEKINATSLNNKEIDDLVRPYNPRLFVKIIDACQSGLAYIKSLDEKIDLSMNKTFENCIFMSSSKRDEPSAANAKCSFFTKAFIEAVYDGTKADVIRYSDIQNYITDEFNTAKYEQTPYFNIQGDGRAVFANTTVALKQMAEKYGGEETGLVEPESELERNLDHFLEAYRSEEAVKEIIEKVKAILQEETLPLTWLDKYYDMHLGSMNSHDYEEDSGIVKFLYERRKNENLYVEVETERARKESYLNIPLLGYETVPIRFTPMVHSLSSNITLNLWPKNEGLPRYEVNLVFVYSDTGMYVFQGARQLVCKGWNDFVEGDKKKYTYSWFEYGKFDQRDWKEYVQKRFIESAEFVEKSLGEFVPDR